MTSSMTHGASLADVNGGTRLTAWVFGLSLIVLGLVYGSWRLLLFSTVLLSLAVGLTLWRRRGRPQVQPEDNRWGAYNQGGSTRVHGEGSRRKWY